MLAASILFAQDQSTTLMTALERVGTNMFMAVVFALLGIALAILGFKLFDRLTPGKLDEEILNKQNNAAAILAGAFVLGVCIIIAAAIH